MNHMVNYYQKEVFERYRRLEQEEKRSMFHWGLP